MASLAQLDVQIRGDITQLQTALNDAKAAILQFAGVSTQAFAQLGGTTQYVTPAIEQVNTSFQQLGNTAKGLTPTILQNTTGFNGFNMILRETHTLGYSLTRGIVSLTYGFSTLGKEITAARAEGQSFGSILTTLGTQFFTMDTAVILAGSAIALWAHHALMGKSNTDEFTKSVEDAAKAMNDAVGKATEESAKLDVLAGMATNAALSMQQRNAAVEKLQNMYPGYFGNLDKEAILTGKIKDQLKLLNEQLLNKALSEAEANNITKFAAQLAEVNDKLLAAKKSAEDAQKIADNSNVGGFTSYAGLTPAQSALIQAQRTVDDLTAQQTKLTDKIKGTIDAMRGYAQGAGLEFEGMGNDIKSVGEILGDLNRKMDGFDALSKATGASEAKEKISALKNAITDLIQAGVQPGNFELQALIKQVKELGGTFEDTGAKTKRGAKTIQDVLDELKNKLAVLNKEGLYLHLDETIPKINALKAAINELINMHVPADNSVFAQLFGQISSLEGPLNLEKIHESIQKQLPELKKMLKDDWDKFVKENKPIDFNKLFTETGDITMAHVKSHMKESTEELKKQFGEIIKIGQSVYQVFDRIFTDLFTKGTISIKEIGNALGQLIAKLIATVIEAAILSAILSATGLGGSLAGGGGFVNVLKSLLGGGLKFTPHAEGGIFTGPTLIGNHLFGEAGPEALIPLNQLDRMMSNRSGMNMNINGELRARGTDLVLVMNRANLMNTRNYGKFNG